MLMKRSCSFVNLYDKESGFIRPKFTDGHWAAPFNPKSIKITRAKIELKDQEARGTIFEEGRKADGSPQSDQRSSPWQGAYHSGRAMILCGKLLKELEKR